MKSINLNGIELIKIDEIAEMTGLDVRTIRNKHYKGEIPAGIKFGRCNLWPKKVVEQWFLSNLKTKN